MVGNETLLRGRGRSLGWAAPIFEHLFLALEPLFLWTGPYDPPFLLHFVVCIEEEDLDSEDGSTPRDFCLEMLQCRRLFPLGYRMKRGGEITGFAEVAKPYCPR